MRRLTLNTLLLSLCLPLLTMQIQAAEADKMMQQSLYAFFNHGVVVQGATAELAGVDHWPEARGTMHWSLPLSLYGHPGRFSLIAEQGARRWYVSVRVHWMAEAIVTRKNIPARTLLTMDMMTKSRTDIAGHSGNWWNDARELAGMRLNRPLAAGAMIQSNQVTMPPLVKRGDTVTIILEAGGLHIRTEGTALRSAVAGERIMVRNMRSQEIIQAVVEKAGLVRVSLNGGQG